MAKKNITFRMDPELIFYAKQLAKLQRRSLTNYIELLIFNDVKKSKAEGIDLKYYGIPCGEIIGSGADEKLEAEFKKFINEG